VGGNKMPRFGRASKRQLQTCHPFIQDVFNEVIKKFDCSILQGIRSKEEQDLHFNSGKSKVQWPNSKHNVTPPDLSLAVDAVPYPIVWPDAEKLLKVSNNKSDFEKELKNYNKALGTFYVFGMIVLDTAKELGIDLRWGGDWDGDFNIKDQNFDDLPHFELRSTGIKK
jgi:peptidoglycan L-alanyl-D-glutamate endopeptidase CwlK